MKPKKSYGQHFLINPDLSKRIAESLTGFGDYKEILEVGPGKGMLTQFLLEAPYELSCVEADRDMVEHLAIHYPQLPQERVYSLDFLKFNPTPVYENRPFAVIGNFPYNISSQILFWMVDHIEQVPEMVGMFQKEVADRVISGEGNKVYGVLTVLIQAYYDCKYLFTVSKGNFFPPPKVTSAVIRLQRKANWKLPCNEKLFKQIVKQTFQQRRKMLRNTMKSFINNPDILAEDFFTTRPEQLSIEDFIQLTLRVEAYRLTHQDEEE